MKKLSKGLPIIQCLLFLFLANLSLRKKIRLEYARESVLSARMALFGRWMKKGVGIWTLVRLSLKNKALRWIGIWPSHTNIHTFAVKNPPGFKGRAFAADEIAVNYRLKGLFGDPTVIDEIEVKHSVLRIDFANSVGTQNNWTALGQMMPKQKKQSHVIIRKLVLTDFNVEVYGFNLFVKTKQTHFDRLEFDNIDSLEGFPTDRLIRLIFQSSGIEQYIQNLFGPSGPIQLVLPSIRFFGN